MLRVSVTGANGYIGNHVVNNLLKLDNIAITTIDRKESIFSGNKKIYNITKDICNEKCTYKNIGSPDVLIHLAWSDGFYHNSEEHFKNLFGHYCFLKNIIDGGCSNINVIGTMHEIGYYYGAVQEDTPCCPLSLYGISKNALRQAILAYSKENNINTKWLRVFYITGDDRRNKSIFSKILELCDKQIDQLPFTSGQNCFDFIDIDQLAKQIVCASLQTEYTGIINCCSGKPIKLADKVNEFIRVNNLKINLKYGSFPEKKSESPAIWGDSSIINQILKGDNFGN